MTDSSSLIGMPWQLAKPLLQAAQIPFKVMIGDNFNRFFNIAQSSYYVARITNHEEGVYVLLYRPMVVSEFGHVQEVMYAENII
ncbi:hypothetical protein [Veillonella caviae]|uniref:hypothetical protein n=1 Tax=Veillonella caviae TaxID=248316 RepID=UPI0023A8512E|nr:hypothetical protein [Veillonella caviae]MCI5708546.1 hypothetical protein [Veillonella caviae]MDY5715170.1 hypothetical protein [Veillonella caviae]